MLPAAGLAKQAKSRCYLETGGNRCHHDVSYDPLFGFKFKKVSGVVKNAVLRGEAVQHVGYKYNDMFVCNCTRGI